MARSSAIVEIAGAGPAGLAAALTVVRAGGRALVRERRAEVGSRFHGDFQGLENWTAEGNVLDELAALGIEPGFEATPFRECVFYDARGRAHTYRSREPLWYLVRRGPDEGTLDSALKAQALAAGVEIEFTESVERLPRGGIVAHGPRRPDAIAVGYVFETERPDGAYAVVSDALAPKGYAYLLTCGGRGTIATCLFRDFHGERRYLERTVEFFQSRLGVEMKNPRRFGGYVNVSSRVRARKGNLLYVGEAAGFQDALFGFGIRYALLSGHLAARAWLEGRPERYDTLWRARLDPILRLALVNRLLYERIGDRGYAWLLRRIDRAPDAREWLARFYTRGPLRRLLYPLARRRFERQPPLIPEGSEGCDCTWCRCERAERIPRDPVPSRRRGS